MAQKPVIPKSRKTVERAKKQAAKGSVKEVKKAVGARGSTLGNIDSLINKHLASFRNAEKRSRKQRRSFKPIAKNILNWRITSRKAQWNTEYTSARMPRMNRKVYTSSTSASGRESSGMKLLGQTNTTISK